MSDAQRSGRAAEVFGPEGGMTGRDRRLGGLGCQAPALAQGRIVFGPVRDPAPLFRDAMTAITIGLERLEASRVTEGIVLLRQPSPHTNRPIRATNSAIGFH